MHVLRKCKSLTINLHYTHNYSHATSHRAHFLDHHGRNVSDLLSCAGERSDLEK